MPMMSKVAMEAFEDTLKIANEKIAEQIKPKIP